MKHLHHYLPLGMSPDDLLKGFAYNNLRRSINKANKIGLKIKQENSSVAIGPFFHLLANTRKRHGLPPIPSKFIASLEQSFDRNQMKILLVYMGNDVIAGMLTLNFNGVSHVEYSGGYSQAYKSGASHFLHWEAIKLAWDMGYKLFSFGRTDTWNEGLLSFKRRWATTEEPICTFLISNNGQHLSPKYKLFKHNVTSRWLFGHAPQLLRNVLASLIYRHHG
jgi:lipid II:glycine glycyltransferase (peptidoglycan interpeptide bridge formation enzyme)